jgi:eukaryotic-like serine/threonine-protein kinase
MAKLAQLSRMERSARAEPEARVPRLRTRFYAFLSYSHRDKELADWLHRELEKFRVPNSLAGKLTANGVAPRRLTPIFRDQHDLSAGGDLAEEIKAALAASQFLVVLCSPTAAKSRWTNQEIESFKRTRPEGCVLAAVLAGEPFASDLPGREDEECFPPALRYKYDRRGHQTARRAEPLAADFRESGEGQRLAFLKLVAGMLGVGLDELVQREQTRRQRHLAWLAAASIAGMAVTSTLAVTAFHARNEAREQRREAEGLIGFMLGDLKDKLEPVGKLDALDGVGTKVLAYYHNQSLSDLSDAALSQRSQALSLMADVASERGNTDSALGLYREAMAGTAEAIRRKSDDPQRLYDHAQNVFYVGSIAYGRGQLDEAAERFMAYKELADRMVALDPNNMKWRMEVQNALANLASVRLAQRRFADAAALSEDALRTIQALTTADPRNLQYSESLVEALYWSADAEFDAGRVDKALTLHERHVALLNSLLAQTNDVSFRQRLVPAERDLGTLYGARGNLQKALEHLRASVSQVDALIALEPANSRWSALSARTRLQLAGILLLTGNKDEAASETEQACNTSARLVAKDPKAQGWRATLRQCWEMRTRVAAAKNDFAQAANLAQRAIDTAGTLRSTDPVADRYIIARSDRLLGDIRKRLGDGAGAAAAWQTGLAALPAGVTERPSEMAESGALLDRVGRTQEARQRADRLSAIGYRDPGAPIK